jgi:hypothetical protein
VSKYIKEYTNDEILELIRDYKWLSTRSHACLMELACNLADRLSYASATIEETLDGYFDKRR